MASSILAKLVREEIETRLHQNLTRVRALVAVYQERAGRGSGRRPVETTDLLRAAVVFLHAAMEDVLRSMLEWKWPQTTLKSSLEDVGLLIGSDLQRKISLADLLVYRGSSIDDVIRLSIGAHLAKSNFNNVGEIKKALKRSDLSQTLVSGFEGDLAAMMARRHLIVHRADRHDVGGSGHHAAASLGQGLVENWIAAVEGFCKGIVAAL